jgi:hypothetical protein
MKDQDFCLAHAEQHPRDPIARKIASNFPKTLADGTAQWHSNRPPVLDPHEVCPMAFRSPASNPRSQFRTTSVPPGVL